MSIVSKVTEAIVRFVPDRNRDELSDAERVMGKPIDRLDAVEKVTGHARFSAEYPLDNLAYAALVYSSIAKGAIKSIDIGQAERARGVIAVLTHENAPKMVNPPLFSMEGGSEAAGSKANVLNTDTIYWNGQPVAMVVADTLERAEHACSLIRIEYQQESAHVSFMDEKVHATVPKDVMRQDPEVRRGDAEAAFTKAPYQTDQIYVTPRYNHNAIEMHATTAVWHGDHLTVYDTSQFVQGVRHSLAKMFSLSKENVRVLAPFVGGGFGGKGPMWSHVQLCALAAKVTKRPVKLPLSREGVFRIVGGRTASEQRVAIGVDKTGHFTSLIHTGVTATSTTNEYAEQFSFPARHLYAADNLYFGQKVITLDTVPNTFMRAPGESIGTFALESAIDEVAARLGMDPVEIRLRNDPDKDPEKGTPFSGRNFKEVYRMGAEKFGWHNRAPKPRATRQGDWWIGQGVATAFYPAYRFPSAAKVRINADGTAVAQSSAQEMGMGTSTVQSQHLAERLGLPLTAVRFEYGDTDMAEASVAGGSSQTISIGLAIQLASDKVHTELLKLAREDSSSPLAGAHFDDVRATNGGLFRRDKSDVGETYTAILERAGRGFVEAEVKTGQPFETLKYSMGSYGAQFCEVRVNEFTGEVRVTRWVGAFDTGRILNPKTASSQFLGGIVMGIGMGLTEETLFDDRTGRIMNPSLAEYHVPVHADVPNMEVYFLDIPDPRTPMGARGIGEIGITGVAAALANAVYHASGKRIRELPITLDKVLEAPVLT